MSHGLSPISLPRLTDILRQLDHRPVAVDGGFPSLSLTVDDYQLTVAHLGSVIVVQANTVGPPSSRNDYARLLLAANEANALQQARGGVAIVDIHDRLIIQTHQAVWCAAGLSDAQLRSGLDDAVKTVIAMQQMMMVLSEELDKRFPQ